MKKVILLPLFVILALPMMAQTAKAIKAMDAKDYPTAKAAFESAISADPNDAAAHLGYSRYYIVAGTGEKDNDKAVEHLETAERIYQSADAKGKAKLEKEGVSAATLKDRRDRTEASILEDVKKVNTIEAYSAFLQKFPNSSVARPAAAYRDKLAFDEATKTGTEAGWNAFINSYPTSEMLKDAITNRNKVGAEEALRANTEEVYAAFVKNYPDAIQAPQMKQRLYAVAFENAKAKNTVSALEDYIRIYPESVLVMQAQERLAQLKATTGQ